MVLKWLMWESQFCSTSVLIRVLHGQIRNLKVFGFHPWKIFLPRFTLLWWWQNFFSQPKEWIWIMWLPFKLCSVYPEDDIKPEEYSKQSEKSPAYWFSPLLSSHCCAQPYCDISSLIFYLLVLLLFSLHPGNPSLF